MVVLPVGKCLRVDNTNTRQQVPCPLRSPPEEGYGGGGGLFCVGLSHALRAI
jgi:hypothetical protein